MENIQRKFILCFGLLMSAHILACDAKRVEAPVQTVDGTTTNQEFKSVSINVDTKLNELIENLDGLNNKVKLTLRTLKTSLQENLDIDYTPIDLIIDSLNAAKKGIGVKRKSNFRKQGLIEIPVFPEGHQCRKMNIFTTGQFNTEQNLNELNISVQSCASNEAVKIIQASWMDNALTIDVSNDAIQDIFNSKAKQFLKLSTKENGCRVVKKLNDKISAIQCNSLIAGNPDITAIVLDHALFSDESSETVNVQGRLLNKGVEKSEFKLSIPKQGAVKFSINKISQE